MARDAMVSLYFPLAIYSGLAAFLFAKGILWPAFRRRILSIKDHGLAIAIVIGLTMDSVETIYYGIGRLLPSVQPALFQAYGAIASMRILVLFTSIVALTAYFQIVDHRYRLRHVVMGAALLWAVAFLFMSTMGL